MDNGAGAADKELIDWVAQQCGLPKLAMLLNDSLKEEGCVTAFAACLFSYTGYCPQEQALQVQKILQTNAGNNETDRAKARGLFPRIWKIFPRAAGI